jgi:hypothetical protein
MARAVERRADASNTIWTPSSCFTALLPAVCDRASTCFVRSSLTAASETQCQRSSLGHRMVQSLKALASSS